MINGEFLRFVDTKTYLCYYIRFYPRGSVDGVS
jgi:hypothetical protein